VMNTWDIFRKMRSNPTRFWLHNSDRVSQPIPDSVNTIAPENILLN
jgi:hypothetical protein